MKFDHSQVEVVIAPPALHLLTLQNALKNENVKLSSQDVSRTGNGAYTGEISAEMLMEAGVEWTLTGQCERRRLFGESENDVVIKTKRALDSGMNVITCVGGEHQFEEKSCKESLERQLKAIREHCEDW
jgi:triosephosphate isomerase